MPLKKIQGPPEEASSDAVWKSAQTLHLATARLKGRAHRKAIKTTDPAGGQTFRKAGSASDPASTPGRRREMRPELRESAERVWANNEAAFRYLASR